MRLMTWLRTRRLRAYRYVCVISCLAVLISFTLLMGGGGPRVSDVSDNIINADGDDYEMANHIYVMAQDDVIADHDLNVQLWADATTKYLFVPSVLKTPKNNTWNYKVNAALSDDIPLNRAIPDNRPPTCRDVRYHVTTLPTVTVIIPFYNEVASLLLRTVHAVILRTPHRLLHQIIIVDDCSHTDNLGQPLEDYLTQLDPRITLLRNTQRQGLIRTRQRAADLATGDVLVFLDSHTEPNVGWSEPLLTWIREHPTSVLQPGLVFIDKDTLDHGHHNEQRPNMGRTAFSWDLKIRWLSPVFESESSPFAVPSFLGCALAVDRNYFFKLGGFDTAMDLWGGENMELAFSAWSCGGSAMTHPCSRVAHVFRPLPYSHEQQDEGIRRNLARVAEVWMEGYTDLFYKAIGPVNFEPSDYTAMAARRSIKTRLNCTNFDVVLQQMSDLQPPPKDATLYGYMLAPRKKPAEGKREEDACLALNRLRQMEYRDHGCAQQNIDPERIFFVDKQGRLHNRDSTRCLLSRGRNMTINGVLCKDIPSETRVPLWVPMRLGSAKPPHLGHPISILLTYQTKDEVLCLTRTPWRTKDGKGVGVLVLDCDPKKVEYQQWQFSYNFGDMNDVKTFGAGGPAQSSRR